MSSELWQASAGTGKTHRLTEAYVEQVVAQGRHPSAVWAITFTERAASELRSRLVARLRAAAPGRALGDPETWPVGTFHTLALRALQRGSDGDGDSPAAAASVGRRVLGTGDDAASMFAAACQRAWWGGDKEVAGAVRALAPQLDMNALPEELWQALAHAREHGCETADALWRGPSEAALADAVAGGLWAWSEDMLARARELKLTPRSGEKLALFAAARPAPAAPAQACELAWADGWRRALGSLDGRGGLRDLAAAPLLRVQLARVDGLLAERRWRALRAPLAQLIDAAWSTYRADKAAAEAWDFTDLIAELVQRLSASQAAWRRLAGGIAWLGVDEAQDTNPLQRRMVRLLVGLEGPAAGPGHAQLWVVGDPKQAIYTFRGADPRAFAALGEDVAAKGGAAHVLAVSRRSHPRLVAAINHLGDHLLGAAYAPLVAQAPAAPRVASDPLAGMWAVTPAASALKADASSVAASPVPVPRPTPASVPAPASASAAELASAEAQAVADLLVDLQAHGVALSACAVLTATSLHIAQLAAVLRRRQLAYGMREGGLLFQQPAVLDTLACLHALAEPGDRLAEATALRSPAWAVGDEALTWLLAPGDAKTCASLQAAAAAAGDGAGGWRRLAAWRRHGSALRALARHGTVVETLQALDGLTQLQAVWAATPDGPLASAALGALWRLAADFDGQGGGGVLDFCRLQAARRARQAPITLGPWQPAEPAVTLATIHQSKGLEFDVVILPHLGFGRRSAGARLQFCSEFGLVGAPRDAAGQPLRPTSHLQATDRAEADLTAERRRLLYVAVTRARRAVFWVGERQGAARGFRTFLADWWPGALADQVVQPWPSLAAPTKPAAAVGTASTPANCSPAVVSSAPSVSAADPAAALRAAAPEVVGGSPVCVVDMAAQVRRHLPQLAVSVDEMAAFFAPPAPPTWRSRAGEIATAERVFGALFAVLAHGPPGLLAAADLTAWVAEQLRVAGAVGEEELATWAVSAAAALVQPSVLPLLLAPAEARRCPPPLQRSWRGTAGVVTLSCSPDLVVEAQTTGAPPCLVWAAARPLGPAAVTLAGWAAVPAELSAASEPPEEAGPALWLAPQRVGPASTDFALRLWRLDAAATARADRLIAHWLGAQLATP